jgi:hypothetical protein
MGEERRKKGHTMTPLLLAVVPIIFLCIAGILIDNEMIGE